MAGVYVGQAATFPPVPVAPTSTGGRPTVGRKTVALKGPAASLYQQRAQKRLPSPPSSPARTGRGKFKRSLSPSSANAAQPPRKRNKKTEMDAAMVAPLPIVEFIQSRVRPKACGYCELCQQPPCGECKECLLNARGKTDKRRCMKLKCVRFIKEEDEKRASPPKPAKGDAPIPNTIEGISAELAVNGEELAMVSAKLSRSQSDPALPELKRRYKKLLDRKSLLHSAQASLRNVKSHRKSPFPVGFPEIWGIIVKLERARVKFAQFVVKQGPGSKSDTVERKRQKRDTLDRTIAEYCQLWSEELVPIDSRDAVEFWKLVGLPRNIPSTSSDDDEEEEEEEEEMEYSEDETSVPAPAADEEEEEHGYSSFSDEDD